MSNTISIRDIAHDVQRDNPQVKMSKTDAEHIARSVFETILERVAKGSVVAVRGFGTFEAKEFKGRKLNSPLMQGGTVNFPDQLILRFRQSQKAKHTINEIAQQVQAGDETSRPKLKGKGPAKAMPKAVTPEAEAPEATPEPEAKANGKAKKGKAAKKPKKGKAAVAPAEPEAEA